MSWLTRPKEELLNRRFDPGELDAVLLVDVVVDTIVVDEVVTIKAVVDGVLAMPVVVKLAFAVVVKGP